MCQVPYLSAQSSSLPESFSRSRTSLGAAKARLCFSPLLVSHTLQCPVHSLLHISDPLSSYCPGSVLSTIVHGSAPTRGTSSVPPQLILSFTELLPKTIVLSLLCSRVLFLSLIFITFIYGGGACMCINACMQRTAQVTCFSPCTLWSLGVKTGLTA